MKTTHWNAFRAVAEHGGFSRAAAATHTSQPALSAHIADLESQLGARLFDRQPRGVSLTAAGALWLDYVHRWSALEAEALQALAELQGLRRGRLRVGASQTIGVYLLPELLGNYHRRYPDIELQAEVANSTRIQELLLRGDIDLALTEGPLPALPSQVFGHDELVPVAPPGHPLLSETLSLADFCGQPLIVREAGSGTREVWETELRRRNLGTARVVMSLGNTEAIKRAVQAGLGLAVVSRLALHAELAAGSLRLLSIADWSLVRPLYRTLAPERTPSPALQAFLMLLD